MAHRLATNAEAIVGVLVIGGTEVGIEPAELFEKVGPGGEQGAGGEDQQRVEDALVRVVVVADREAAEAEVAVTFGELVLIEQDLFGAFERSFFTAEDGILKTGLFTGVVKVVASLLRDGGIRFEHAALHLGVEHILEGTGVTHHFLEIVTFCV